MIVWFGRNIRVITRMEQLQDFHKHMKIQMPVTGKKSSKRSEFSVKEKATATEECRKEKIY